MTDRIKRALFILMRLYHNQAGNTLMIVAAATIPLMGLIGGGVDMSRIYLTKARLQQACDAGALAGRKTMGGGAWSANNNQPLNAATSLFDSNFRPGSYGSGSVTRTFSESAGKVTGTASVPLPMAIMRVFGIDSKIVRVACDAEMRLPNTDVMFVLDVTGSMDSPIPGDAEDKIVGLRRAVRCFYEIVARLDTIATCDGGAPSGGTTAETQIRFGFVPYATNVNVGKLLPSNWFVDSAAYQSREITTVYGRPLSYTDGNKGNWSGWSSTKTASTNTEADCRINYVSPGIGQQVKSGSILLGKNETNGGVAGHGNWDATQTWQDVEGQFVSWSSSSKACKYKTRTRDFSRTYAFVWSDPTGTGAVPMNAWLYQPVTVDVRGLKSGDGWNSPSTLTIANGNNFTNRTITWNGCIEERRTVRAASYLPTPDGAFDLDVNTPPSLFNDDTRWRPALGITYQRKESSDNGSERSLNPIVTFTNFSGGSFSCPTQASRLVQWQNAGAFDSYVESLTPGGNTYHDIGLIWGARLMSPTGLFATDNATTARGGEIQRHMIFMTDGDACTDVGNYQAYGLAWYDRRQTEENVAPTDGCSTTGTLTEQVNARTQAICAAVRNMPNTTLWVVWFGTANATLENMLRTCATPDRFFSARSSPQLQATFRNIANQISQLRLTS